ncbi:U2 snRNP component prp10 [Blastocladiella emersonii ATCC 22665]|nr:U2 snRNP component prp10 [Blastocladiella emersonii ATCC 22665]
MSADPRQFLAELEAEGADLDPMQHSETQGVTRKIAERESTYHARRLHRALSPDRKDAFAAAASGAAGSADASSSSASSYADVMRQHELDREEHRVRAEIARREREAAEEGGVSASAAAARSTTPPAAPLGETPRRRRRRWDETPVAHESGAGSGVAVSEWDRDEPAPKSGSGSRSRWDETPRDEAGAVPGATPRAKRSRWDETPVATASAGPSRSRWDETPRDLSETPRAKRSRWDETPVNTGLGASIGANGVLMTPVALAPDAATEMDQRNAWMTDEELDVLLPSEGYKILDPPASYKPIRNPARKLTATPAHQGFFMSEGSAAPRMADIPGNSLALQDLPSLKQEDLQFFGKLLDDKPETDLSLDELKERKVMRLLIKIKNGTPPVRKVAMRQITDKARDFGPGPLFNQILPLLMSPSLEDQERHLLVKVIDRVLYKLDDLVRPYVHKILVVIEPLLIDEDYYARIEGREIISNLAKAAGLATMIATMRPDIDHVDEYVRNTTARAFAVVGSALGIPALLPFLKAVCRSKKSWQARHTGIKIIQQIALLMGCAVLPHLKNLVSALADGLQDEQQKVRTITALAIAALAEAAHPYGIDSFEDIVVPLWTDLRKHRGKALAAFLKAIGSLIPLMETAHADYYTTEAMPIIIREFASPDDEMRKIVLKVVKQTVGTDGITPDFVREKVLDEFFRNFWVRRMALDKRNAKPLVETTVEIAKKSGVGVVLERLVPDLKDESEAYRKMVMDAIEQVVSALGVADVDLPLEQRLIDGMLFAFQEQSTEDVVMLNGFGTIVNALGNRVRPYLQQICTTILWRLNNKSAKVRQQAADLVSRVAIVLRTCGEEKLLSHLGVVLYEYLGEEYPEVLGSILGALKAIVNVIGMTEMNPPIKDLLPRLTPILRNRHEKVQENVIDLVGRIADRGASYVSAREWMRICFELLDLLKAHKKAIRRAAVNTFGYIAKAIGPQDVLATLLNNLKVQERQNRVCTTVAIAIVAETCAPFTVLPALMCEYRVPELNVQNGVLKSLSFLFEYIGEMGKDYVYAVTPLLEDALIDRDLVHRQTACTTVKHLALGVAGLGCEDAMVHLLNHVWPNIFETSPHVINAVTDAVEALRVALGPGVLLNYVLQGLFHPARRVREVYWKVYNTMYIGAQDTLVPYLPRLESDDRFRWARDELAYF